MNVFSDVELTKFGKMKSADVNMDTEESTPFVKTVLLTLLLLMMENHASVMMDISGMSMKALVIMLIVEKMSTMNILTVNLFVSVMMMESN